MDYFQFAIPPYGFIHSKTFLSATFIALGFLLRQPIEKVLLRDMQRVFCSMIATGAILLCAVKWLPVMTMDVDYEHSIVYILMSFVGVVFTLSASKWMFSFAPLRNFLVYIGKNTLIIFFLHLSAFKIISFFLIEYCDLPFNWLAKINIPMGHAWILYSLAGVLLPVGIYYLWEKHVVSRFELDKIVTPYISRFIFAAASRIQMIVKHSDDDCKKN